MQSAAIGVNALQYAVIGCSAFRPLRPFLCREQRWHQEQALAGRYAALDPSAFLPAVATRGARDGNVRGGLALEILHKGKAEKQRLYEANERKELNEENEFNEKGPCTELWLISLNSFFFVIRKHKRPC